VTYAQRLLRMNSVDQAAAAYLGLLSSIVNAFEVPAPPDGNPMPRWAFVALAVRREGRWDVTGGPLSRARLSTEIVRMAHCGERGPG